MEVSPPGMCKEDDVAGKIKWIYSSESIQELPPNKSEGIK
jgi:hypothetical protein